MLSQGTIMLAEKIKQLCHHLNIAVPHPSPQGEYFFSFEDSIFTIISEVPKGYFIWSLIGLLPSNESEYNTMLREIGSQSMRLLSGLTCQYFPIPFTAHQELRLGMRIPQHHDLLEALTILVEDVGLWRKGLRIGATSQPIPSHTSRILKF